MLPSFTVDTCEVKRCLPLLLALACGCSSTRVGLPPLPANGMSPDYRIGCPDVLEISIASQPKLDGVASVDIDGRLAIPNLGKPRVEGLTAKDAATAIADLAEVETKEVTVRVVEPRSAKVIVTGPANARTRILPYRGPEPVLDFLRRTETIPPAASSLNRVYVMRSNVAAGTPPRLYHVDVEAIVWDGDATTNMELAAGDHIYIGETPRSSISRLLPDWAKPLYRKLVGLLPESMR